MHSNCEKFLCIVVQKRMKYTGLIRSEKKEGTVIEEEASCWKCNSNILWPSEHITH